MTKHEALIKYISEYPELKKGLQFNALKMEKEAFALTVIDNDIVIKRYLGPMVRKQYTFEITGIKRYNGDIVTNINIQSIVNVDEFANWINQKNKKKEFPDIEGIQKITASKSNYNGSDQNDLAKYSFTVYLEYIEEE